MSGKERPFTDDDNSIASASVSHEETGTESGQERDKKDGGDSLAQTLARQETRAVRCLRFVVLLVLIAAATAVSSIVYLYIKRDEEENFEEQFFDLAHRLGKKRMRVCFKSASTPF